MKVLKLLTVPAVLLAGLVFAMPASAHTLTNVTVTVVCDQFEGQVCVTLTGDIPATGNDARNVVFDLFAAGSTKSLGEIEFNLPASNGSSVQHFKQMLCFKAISDNIPSFTVEVVKVTDTQGNLSDLAITIGSKTINFTPNDQPATPVGDAGKCAPPAQTTPTPTATATSTPTSTANTTVALAQTGGFDFRFPLVGLALLVVGGILFVVSASRGRSARTK